MHKLAKSLGVSTTALYRHVANKEELVFLCTDLVTRSVEIPTAQNWQEYLTELGRAYRRAALNAPGSVEFLRYVGLQTPHGLRLMDHALGVMRGADFDPEGAFMAVAGVLSHATDMALHQEIAEQRERENSEDSMPDLTDLPNIIWAMSGGVGADHDRNFEVGLQIVVEGIAVTQLGGAGLAH